MKTFDTIIIGGGIVGLTSAFILSQQKKNVLLIEQRTFGHDGGSSHGDGRMTRYAYGADEAIYLEMVKQSFVGWEKLSLLGKTQLVQTTGLLNFGSPNSIHLNELEIAFADSKIAYEHLTASECNQRFSQFHVEPNTEVIYEPSGGIIFADKAIQTLAKLCRGNGVTLITGERVQSIIPHNDLVTIKTQAGTNYIGKSTVIATGGWANHLLAELDVNLDLEVTQEQFAFFRSTGDINHAVGAMPNCLDYHTDQPLYSLAEVDGNGVKVGWHHTGKVINADKPLPVDQNALEVVIDFVKHRFPHLDPNPIHVKPCLYTNTADYHFVMDRHPQFSNIILAVGFSGHGFKFGTVLGEIVASLINQTAPPVAIDLFALDRFQKPDSLKRRVTA